MNKRPFKPTLAAVLACGLLLAACQKKDATTPATSPAATSPAPAMPASGAASSPP